MTNHQKFPALASRAVVLFVSLLLLSESTAASVGSYGLKIAQQPTTTRPKPETLEPKPTPLTPPRQQRTQTNTPDSNRAAAEKAEAEAGQLGKQKAPLLTQVIPKWEEALKYWRLAKDRKEEAKTLNKIAGLYWLRGEYAKALEYAQKSLPICQALKERNCEEGAITFLSWSYDSLGEYQKAIDNYQQLASPRFSEDPNLRRSALNSIGSIYASDLGETQKGLDYYNQALAFWKEKGDVGEQAEILEKIAIFDLTLGEINKSVEILQQANTIDPEFKRKHSLYDVIYLDLANSICTDKLASLKKPTKIEQPKNSSNQSATAIPNAATYNLIEKSQLQAQEYRKQESLASEADQLNFIGAQYQKIGEYPKAIEVYKQELKLRRIMGAKPKEAETLTNIAGILNKQSKKQEAINFLNQALDIQHQIKTPPAEADILKTLGDVYLSLGAYPESLNAYNQALSLWENIGNSSSKTSTLMNIGYVYRKLQNYPQSLNYYQQALSKSQTTGNCRQEALSLNQISRTYLNSGDYKQAISVGNQALDLSRNLEVIQFKSVIEAAILNVRAQVEIKQGNYSQALEDSQKARKLARESGFRDVEGSMITLTAEAYAALKQPQKAIQTYQEQLALYNEIGLLSEQAQSLYNIAKLQRQNNQLPEALTEIDKAIEKIENIRKEVASEDLKTSFFATVQDYYRLKIDILMELHKKDPSKGYDAQAIETSERSRARGLVELLTEAHANIRKGANPQLLAEESRLQALIDAREKLRFEIVKSNKIQDPIYKANAENFQKEIDELLRQQKELETKIRQSSPKYGNLKYPKPLTLPEIQQQLDKDTLLLQYSLGEERSFLWAVTPSSMQVYTLPGREEIEKIAVRLHSSLAAAISELAIENAKQLSQLILAPVADKLPGKRLIIVADGALQTIPFAALADITPQPKGGAGEEVKYQPLMLNHEIVNLPSASTIALQRQELANRKPAPKALAILADPVYSATDCRVTVTCKPEKSEKPEKSQLGLELERSALERSARSLKREGWDRLENTAIEAKEILKLVPAASSLEALDFDANYNWATSSALNQFRILHFATHGFVNEEQPELSGIVLSLVDKKGKPINGYLRLGDLFNQDYPAELIVLSACETGLGKNVNGEGLVGLTRGLMYAGAARVVVSLWQVSDKGTSLLMQEFYKQMLQQGKTPAQAMRAAQRKLWQDGRTLDEWAAFTMQGEWR